MGPPHISPFASRVRYLTANRQFCEILAELEVKAAEKNRKLPEELDVHIKNGNSLVDDNTLDPKNYFEWTI